VKTKDKVKVKPIPKPVKKVMPIYQLAALVEFHFKNVIADDFSCWPNISIEEARQLVKDINPKRLDSMRSARKMYDNTVEGFSATDTHYAYEDVKELRNALINKELSIGMSISLFVEHFNIEKNDPMMLTFVYSWASHVRSMVDKQRVEQEKIPAKENQVCFDIDLGYEHALELAIYCEAAYKAFHHRYEYLKSIRRASARNNIPVVESKFVTDFRNDNNYLNVPRSIIQSSMNNVASRIQFGRKIESDEGRDYFYTKDNFKLTPEGLTIGEAKDMGIFKMHYGEITNKKVKGLQVERLSDLRYRVTAKY